MTFAHSLAERELASHLPALAKQEQLTLLGTEVRIGGFRLDAVASAPDGSLVIIELKTTRWMGTLAQLLLYLRALRRCLEFQGLRPPQIRSLLITTYLDCGLLDLITDHELTDVVDVRLCVGTLPNDLRLVKPSHSSAASALLDQATGPHTVERITSWVAQQGVDTDIPGYGGPA